MVECEGLREVKGTGRVEKLDEPVNGPLEHVVALLKHRGCGIAISLSGEPSWGRGCQTIARAVRQNTSLTHLDLRLAGLDNRAAAALGCTEVQQGSAVSKCII